MYYYLPNYDFDTSINLNPFTARDRKRPILFVCIVMLRYIAPIVLFQTILHIKSFPSLAGIEFCAGFALFLIFIISLWPFIRLFSIMCLDGWAIYKNDEMLRSINRYHELIPKLEHELREYKEEIIRYTTNFTETGDQRWRVKVSDLEAILSRREKWTEEKKQELSLYQEAQSSWQKYIVPLSHWKVVKAVFNGRMKITE